MRGRHRLEDYNHPGRPVTVVAQEIIKKILERERERERELAAHFMKKTSDGKMG